jgi:hypothetical protein
MPDLGPLVGELAELFLPLFRAAVGAFFRTAAGMLLLGLGAAGLSAWIAGGVSPVRALVGVAATLVIFALLGGVLVVKRAVGKALLEGLRRFGVGRRVTELLFAQMLDVSAEQAQGERGVAVARVAERLPLAEAEARLSGAVRTLTAPRPGKKQRWLARLIECRMIATVERYTLDRFRDEARTTGGVDLIKVQKELRQWIDARLADVVQGKLRALSLGVVSLACALSLLAGVGIRHFP